MTSHTLQLDPPLDVVVKQHGAGWALLYTDYGPDLNAVFLVALKTDGSMRHYSATQVKLARNHTYDLATARAQSEVNT